MDPKGLNLASSPDPSSDMSAQRSARRSKQLASRVQKAYSLPGHEIVDKKAMVLHTFRVQKVIRGPAHRLLLSPVPNKLPIGSKYLHA